MTRLKLEWIDGEATAKCPSDPNYPQGVDIEERPGASSSCFTKLPYPAPRIGVWSITCPHCRRIAVITAAGREDDPRSFRMACRPIQGGSK